MKTLKNILLESSKNRLDDMLKVGDDLASLINEFKKNKKDVIEAFVSQFTKSLNEEDRKDMLELLLDEVKKALDEEKQYIM